MAEKSYTAMPAVPPELTQRYQTLMEVLSGSLTVSEGARRLGLSRNHFQSLMHRALTSLIEELTPRAGGRPATPARERQLQEEAEQLRRENQRLRRRAETTERVLSVASELLQGRAERGRSRERATKRAGSKPTEDE
jgi:hypothetical protein